MANVEYNNIAKSFVINNRANRPAWQANFKRDLLADFVNTNWAKQTSLAQLMRLFQDLPMNQNGVIEALERRHVLSWNDICIVYEIFINIETKCWPLPRNLSTVKEAVQNLIFSILGSRSTQSRELQQYGVEVRRYKGNFNSNAVAQKYGQYLPCLNSSTRNVFIGPARKNRQLGFQYDQGSDLPREMTAGRPLFAQMRNLSVIMGYYDEASKEMNKRITQFQQQQQRQQQQQQQQQQQRGFQFGSMGYQNPQRNTGYY